MLLLIISLFLHYDFLSCVTIEKTNFDEALLMEQQHRNFHQINAFLKEAQHRFHEEKSVLREGDYGHITAMDFTNTPQTPLFPVIRSRPSFPISITPYTTELNDHHLKWDEIFPHQNSILRHNEELQDHWLGSSSTLLNWSLTQTPSIPNTKDKNMLKQITIERWFQTLVNKIGVTPSYTTNRATQLSRTLSNTQTTVQNRQLKNVSKDQQHPIYRQGLALSHTPNKDKDYRIATATTNALFFIENVGGILHLRTATVKDGRRTVMIDGRPATIPDDANMKVTPTIAGEVLYREQDREIPRHSLEYSDGDKYRMQREQKNSMLRRMEKTADGLRIFNLNTQSWQGKKKQKSRVFFSNRVTRPIENAKLGEPTYLPTPISQSLSELDDIENEKLIELIEAQEKLQHKKTTEKDKISLYNQVKESLKATAKKKKDKKVKAKAELIRKIAEGSSYSDEEASLRKNLIEALHYRNRTYS